MCFTTSAGELVDSISGADVQGGCGEGVGGGGLIIHLQLSMVVA